MKASFGDQRPTLTNITRGNARQRSRGRGQLCESPPIRHDVREDQREREEHKTEEKVEKEAVSLPARNPGGPERDRNPNDEEQDRAEPPTVRRDEHSSLLVGRRTMQHRGRSGRARAGLQRRCSPARYPHSEWHHYQGGPWWSLRGPHSLRPGVQTHPRPRTQVAAARGRPLRQLESGSRFPRKHHQKTCRLGRGSLPGEHLPSARCLKRNRSGD